MLGDTGNKRGGTHPTGMHSCFNSFVQVDQNNLLTAKTFVGLYYLMDMWHLFSLWAMLIQLFATKILLIIVSSELSNLTYTIDKNPLKWKKRVNVAHFMVHMISLLSESPHIDLVGDIVTRSLFVSH